MDAKYVVIDYQDIGMQMFVFSFAISHRDFAKRNIINENDKVISAGFIRKQTPFSAMYCYGESISLNVRTNSEVDNFLLKRLLFDTTEL